MDSMRRLLYYILRYTCRLLIHIPCSFVQYVLHDTAKLIELQGSAKKFIERLDWMFDNVGTLYIILSADI